LWLLHLLLEDNYSFCNSGGKCDILVLRNLIFDGQGVTQDAVRAAGITLLAEDCAFTRFRLGVYVIGGGAYQFKNCVFQFTAVFE